MTAKTARARAREQITAEILAAARTRLTDAGPGELSLRAVARDVGMVSSAVYRYYASRDDLLTALLMLAYDELGAAVEDADAAVDDRGDTGARWRAACHAIRTWALSHPGDYALLFGSPVPGYTAPPETIEPAIRGTLVLVRIVIDAHLAGATSAPPPPAAAPPERLAAVLGAAVDFIHDRGLPDPDPEVVMRTTMAWSFVFGTVSFELWGHLVGSVTDNAAYFDEVVTRLGTDIGLL